MRKLKLLGLLAGILPFTAHATPVSCQLLTGTQRGITCTCATGTCDPSSGTPTKPTSTPAATAAVQIGTLVTVLDVKMCPTTASATITASKVDVYYYDGGGWAASGSTCTGGASRAADGCVWVQCDSPGKGIPIISKRASWAQVIPNGTTTSAGGVKVEVYPSGPAGGQ